MKVQVESLKYDIREKTELLREAGMALEQLENNISVMSIEREEEKQRLEAKIKLLEEDDFHIQALASSTFADEDKGLNWT